MTVLRKISIAEPAPSPSKIGRAAAVHGATGTLLVHSLKELRTLADQMVPETRPASAKTSIRFA